MYYEIISEVDYIGDGYEGYEGYVYVFWDPILASLSASSLPWIPTCPGMCVWGYGDKQQMMNSSLYFVCFVGECM